MQHISVTVAASETDRRASELRVVMFVDGVQQTLRDSDDSLTPYIALEAPPGTQATRRVRIDAGQISDGAHSMVLALVDRRWGGLFGGTTYTLLKNGVDFGQRKDDTSRTRRVNVRRDSSSVAYTGDRPLFTSPPLDEISADGSLPLRLVLQTKRSEGCTGRRIPVVVMALVDGEQISLGDFGPFLRVIIDDNEGAELELELHDLPLDGKPHVLTLIQTQGDGLYTEAPPGTATPWLDYSLTNLGAAHWGR